jgi:peptidoglycan/xylan/chitin deacetylase (PgdA/CDA1 family)
VKQRPDIARAIQAAGHTIGNHTFTHPNLALASPSRLKQELTDCRKALEDAIGAPAPLFRPPFGGRRPDVLRTVRAMGMEPVMWSVTAFDWSARSSEFIVDKVSKEVERRRGSRSEIVLLHDGGHLGFGADRAFTVEATKVLLSKYADKKFVAIPELTR